MKNKVVIVGAGPAGLYSSYLLLKKGYRVELYDQSTACGKKFLVAGNGGLNLTHSEELTSFSTRYGKDQDLFSEIIGEFTPQDLRDFCLELGVETFVGSSGRVFPKELKAAQILKNWIDHLKASEDFELFLRHELIELHPSKELTFKFKEEVVQAIGDVVVLAMGGASWKRTGSDGKWKAQLEKLGVEVKPFLPMNCGFECDWSEHFISTVDRAPIKNVGIKFQDRVHRGEIMITPFGIEGGGIYAVSNIIRDNIIEFGHATVSLDLKPDLSLEQVLSKLKNKKAKDSLSNHLRKSLGIGKVENTLLKEILPKDAYTDLSTLAQAIKDLKVDFKRTRPIEEAISTSGGIAFSELDQHFQIKKLAGFYAVGEMLDFEAPTGGYLLQGCFSTAARMVRGI